MVGAIYVLCSLTSLACASLVLRRYRERPVRLLLWVGLGLIGLALNNAVLFLDLVVFPDTDLFLLRSAPALTGMGLLVIGLVWDA